MGKTAVHMTLFRSRLLYYLRKTKKSCLSPRGKTIPLYTRLLSRTILVPSKPLCRRDRASGGTDASLEHLVMRNMMYLVGTEMGEQAG